jgi:hypothetical protein
MLITDYSVIKLYRTKERQWIILGQCNDVPGGTRPHTFWPIVGVVNQKTEEVEEIPRTRAEGFIDTKEQFGYFYLKYFKRANEELVVAVDEVRIEFNGVRIA